MGPSHHVEMVQLPPIYRLPITIHQESHKTTTPYLLFATTTTSLTKCGCRPAATAAADSQERVGERGGRKDNRATLKCSHVPLPRLRLQAAKPGTGLVSMHRWAPPSGPLGFLSSGPGEGSLQRPLSGVSAARLTHPVVLRVHATRRYAIACMILVVVLE